MSKCVTLCQSVSVLHIVKCGLAVCIKGVRRVHCLPVHTALQVLQRQKNHIIMGAMVMMVAELLRICMSLKEKIITCSRSEKKTKIHQNLPSIYSSICTKFSFANHNYVIKNKSRISVLHRGALKHCSSSAHSFDIPHSL